MSIFGAISDVFESAGDVLFGERGSGQRTQSFKGAVQSLATKDPRAYLAARTMAPTRQTASGREGQVATAIRQPGPIETSYSSVAQLPMPRLPAPRTTIPRNFPPTVGRQFMDDIIPDISISKFFGNGMPNICGTGQKRPYSVNARTGCLSVTRKQQRMLREMLQFRTLDEASASVGLTKDEYTALALKQFPARRRGITASQLRTAKRVNNNIIRMHDQLASAFKTTTARRSTRAAGTRVTQIKN